MRAVFEMGTMGRESISLFKTSNETSRAVEWFGILIGLAFLKICHHRDLTKSGIGKETTRNDLVLDNENGNCMCFLVIKHAMVPRRK
jgi:hypothetical protein